MKDKGGDRTLSVDDGVMQRDVILYVDFQDVWQEVRSTKAVLGQVLYSPLLSLSIWHIQSCGGDV